MLHMQRIPHITGISATSARVAVNVLQTLEVSCRLFRDARGTENLICEFRFLYLYLYSKLKKLTHSIFYCGPFVRRFGIVIKADWLLYLNQ
jgi:hypothetical protein